MPNRVNVRPFQCCAPNVQNFGGYLVLGAENGSWLNDALRVTRTNVAVNYTASDTGDFIIDVDTTGGAVTITLSSTSALLEGKCYIIKDSGGAAVANNITIATAGAETIDGAAAATIAANYGVLRLYSNSTDWLSW